MPSPHCCPAPITTYCATSPKRSDDDQPWTAFSRRGPDMLDPTEAQTLAEQFGASPGQIARDHLISPRRRAAPGCRPAASPTPRVPQPALEPSTHPSTRRRASRPALPRGTDRARATPQPHRLPALARAPRQPHPALHRRPTSPINGTDRARVRRVKNHSLVPPRRRATATTAFVRSCRVGKWWNRLPLLTPARRRRAWSEVVSQTPATTHSKAARMIASRVLWLRSTALE